MCAATDAVHPRETSCLQSHLGTSKSTDGGGTQQATEHRHGLQVGASSISRFSVRVSSTSQSRGAHPSKCTAARWGHRSGAGAPLSLAFSQADKTSMAPHSGCHGSSRSHSVHKHCMGTQVRGKDGRRACRSTAVTTALSKARSRVIYKFTGDSSSLTTPQTGSHDRHINLRCTDSARCARGSPHGVHLWERG